MFQAIVIAEAAPVDDGDAARLVVLINELGPGLSEMSALFEFPAISNEEAMSKGLRIVETSAK